MPRHKKRPSRGSQVGGHSREDHPAKVGHPAARNSSGDAPQGTIEKPNSELSMIAHHGAGSGARGSRHGLDGLNHGVFRPLALQAAPEVAAIEPTTPILPAAWPFFRLPHSPGISLPEPHGASRRWYRHNGLISEQRLSLVHARTK
jgi:hypothetical protein